MNRVLVGAGALGFSAIALGAYGDHGLRGTLDAELMRSFETALRYQILHALALLAIGIGLAASLPNSLHKRLLWAAAIMIMGTVIFSGSILASIMLDIKSLTMATPFGGMTLMASWLMLVWAGLRKTA
jgi:uncharacterized membrane protein YgdD (TMEM256/DUF423 family)